jgi:hypothetical protein
MKKPLLRVAVVIALLAGVWAAMTIDRARRDLVSLNVRDMDVRKVAKKIGWQTWETILVHKDVQGTVTLKVRKAPLDYVLGVIGEQTMSRWMAVYPVYRNKKSLPSLEKVLLGEASGTTWTNLHTRGFPRGDGPFGENVRNQNSLISISLQNKELPFAAMALSRYAQAQIVPEDGASGVVQLQLNQARLPDAVARLAKQVRRKQTRYYALQPFRTPGGPPGMIARGPRGEDGRPRFDGDFPRPSPEQREEMRKQFEALQETMTPEERQRLEERRQQFQEMQNLTPEQRRERFQQMAQSPEMQQRMQNRLMSGIKNTTPEQRVERDRRRLQERQRREQQAAR